VNVGGRQSERHSRDGEDSVQPADQPRLRPRRRAAKKKGSKELHLHAQGGGARWRGGCPMRGVAQQAGASTKKTSSGRKRDREKTGHGWGRPREQREKLSRGQPDGWGKRTGPIGQGIKPNQTSVAAACPGKGN